MRINNSKLVNCKSYYEGYPSQKKYFTAKKKGITMIWSLNLLPSILMFKIFDQMVLNNI